MQTICKHLLMSLATLGLFVSVSTGAIAQGAPPASTPTGPNQTVVIVNGEEIKSGEYFRRMEFMPGIGTYQNERFEEQFPGVFTMQRLIDERLMLQVAQERKCYPTDAEVASYVTERREVEPNFEENWIKMGFTKEELTYQARLELAQFRVQTQGINITDLEVEKFYKENPSRFSVGKKYKLRIIVVNEDKKADVDADLKANKPFAEIAKARSIDLTNEQGGSIGEVGADGFAEVVRTAIEATKIGATTDWIKGQNTWVRFFVEGVTPPRVIPLDAPLKRDLRRNLAIDRGRVKNDLGKILREARKKAVVDVKHPGFKDTMKRLLDTYKLGA